MQKMARRCMLLGQRYGKRRSAQRGGNSRKRMASCAAVVVERAAEPGVSANAGAEGAACAARGGVQQQTQRIHLRGNVTRP